MEVLFMKYCSKCGKEIMDDAVICIHCGCSTVNNPNPAPSAPDAPSTGFAVLGFFFPLVGLIMYLVMRDTTPLKAKSAGKGALIGVCVEVGLSILYAIIVGVFLGSYAGSYYNLYNHIGFLL